MFWITQSHPLSNVNIRTKAVSVIRSSPMTKRKILKEVSVKPINHNPNFVQPQDSVPFWALPLDIPIITIKRKATMKATPESRNGGGEGMHERIADEKWMRRAGHDLSKL